MLAKTKRALERFEREHILVNDSVTFSVRSFLQVELFFLKADGALAYAIAEKYGEFLLCMAGQTDRLEFARRLIAFGVGDPGTARFDDALVPELGVEFSEGGFHMSWNPTLEFIISQCDRSRLKASGFYGLGPPALRDFCASGCLEGVRALANHGVSLNRFYGDGLKADNVGMICGQEDLVHYLIEKGQRQAPIDLFQKGKNFANCSSVSLFDAVRTNNPLFVALVLRKYFSHEQSESRASRESRKLFLTSLLGQVRRGSPRDRQITASLLVAAGACPSLRYNGKLRDAVRQMSISFSARGMPMERYLLHNASLRNFGPNWLSDGGNSYLTYAVHDRDPAAVRMVLRAGAYSGLLDGMMYSPMLDACRLGHQEVVKRLLRAGADTKPMGFESVLYAAARSGCVPLVQLLLAHGVDPNDPESVVHPLAGAIYSDSEPLVNILIDAGAKIHPKDSRALDPLVGYLNRHMTPPPQEKSGIRWSDCFISIIRKHGAKAARPTSWSALHQASVYGTADEVFFLISVGGADVNHCDDDGVTPLMVACRENNIAAAKVLLKNGADCRLRTRRPLHLWKIYDTDLDAFLLAAAGGSERCCRLLVRKGGADPATQSSSKMNALHLIHTSWVEDSRIPFDIGRMTETLIQLGTPVSVVGDDGDVPAHYMACMHQIRSLSAVCASGADVNARNQFNGNTCLQDVARACCVGYIQCDCLLRVVQELGANLETLNNTGQTALHVSAIGGLFGNCLTLISLGANLNARDSQGRTPLMMACVERSFSKIESRSVSVTVKTLLDAGADIEARSDRGLRALHFAARSGLGDVCRLLLNYGADVRGVSRSTGRSVLHLAVESTSRAVVSVLVSHGAKLDCTDAKGYTPLLIAVRKDQMEMCAHLLELGANAAIRSRRGMSALDVAKRRGFANIVRLLESSDARHLVETRGGEADRNDTLVGGEMGLVDGCIES